MSNTLLDSRQTKLLTALPMVGSASGATLDGIFPVIDAELAKHFEDRNIFLTDGGTVTFTGTQLQLTEALKLAVNQKISGAVPQIISLGTGPFNFTNSGDMLVATIDRTAGTATVTIVTNGNALPAAAFINQEVFLIAKRTDAADGTQRLYFRNGSSLNAGQSVRLGQGGSGGSGSGTGDDLDALTFRASFSDAFGEASTQAVSSILTSGTNAAFSAAKSMYTMQYDATKTVVGTGTAMTFSSAPAFTVAVGDVIVIGTAVRKITAVASQTSVTIEASWPSDPSATACTISQAVYTKDIYNSALDGAAIATSFPGTTFSEIMVDYKDNAVTGSNLWTPDVTPLVAFNATNDGTNFTAKSVRATNTTDTMGSVILPSAGSALSLRFFANATTGTGFANLITYKAFMQKALTATTGGIMNSAYGFTNGVGTPVNATLSVVGGKTTITLGWNYAVGAFSGTSEASIEVYVNGVKFPRFLDSITTPDGSWTEVSSNVIALDKNYSQLNLSFNVIQRTNGQPVDSSTANVTAISQIQEASNMGFQGFINTQNTLLGTTNVGTPAAGSFYSTIQNRAPVPDFSQDLKPRMGLERFVCEQLVLSQSEFGPNGEAVWTILDDTFNQIRFIGAWNVGQIASPQGSIPAAANVGDAVEVTFYGTALNLLTLFNGASIPTVTVSVDGTTVSSNVYTTAGSSVFLTRNYNVNQIIPIVSGLTMGVHTVRLTMTATGGMNLNVYGFEAIAASSSVITSPGVSYLAGKKMTAASQSTIAYNAAVTGVRGGRVLQYQTAAGTIAQAFTPVNAAAAYITATDHTNEEIVRTYHYREFGSGRTDDFSQSFASATRAFTLDDGTTTLTVSNYTTVGYGPTLGDGLGSSAGSGDYLVFDFVGTGLDVINVRNATVTQTYTVFVDGVTVLTSTLLGGSGLGNIVKIASGLPYGSHTVKILATSTGTSLLFSKFVVYQPKTPTLPTGAVSLGAYNVMANYVGSTGDSSGPFSTGTLAKTSVRELFFSGTWSTAINTVNQFGWQVLTSNSGSYFQYTFFGTGINLACTYASGAPTSTVQIDGTAYTGAATVAPSANGSWNPGTSVFTVNATGQGAQLQIAGLTLGVHTIRVTATSTNPFYINSLEVVTPIHSARSNTPFQQQNTLTVGSQGIQDNRVLTPVKDFGAQLKNVAQVVGVFNSPTSSTTVALPLVDMSTTIKVVTGTRIRVAYSTFVANNTANTGQYVIIVVDGVQYNLKSCSVNNANTGGTISDVQSITVGPGTHKVDLYWYASSGTMTSVYRSMLVEEA